MGHQMDRAHWPLKYNEKVHSSREELHTVLTTSCCRCVRSSPSLALMAACCGLACARPLRRRGAWMDRKAPQRLASALRQRMQQMTRTAVASSLTAVACRHELEHPPALGADAGCDLLCTVLVLGNCGGGEKAAAGHVEQG